jgi:hypothetical protein
VKPSLLEDEILGGEIALLTKACWVVIYPTRITHLWAIIFGFMEDCFIQS